MLKDKRLQEIVNTAHSLFLMLCDLENARHQLAWNARLVKDNQEHYGSKGPEHEMALKTLRDDETRISNGEKRAIEAETKLIQLLATYKR